MADNTLYELRDALVDAYDDLPRAQEIAERAGIVPGTLPSSALPMREWWWEAIQALQRQGKLRALVDAAISDPTVAALKPRFQALREPVSQMQSSASSSAPGAAPQRGAAGAASPAAPGGPRSPKPTVFISYSHVDSVWKERLVTHLSILADEGLFEVWDDTRIGGGQVWEREIEEAMSSAVVAVLMVSPDFLASKFVKTREVPRLLQRREQEGLRVIPVIVRPCPWQRIPWLSAMQARPKEGRPLAGGTGYQLDADLAAIAEEIADILQAFETPRPMTNASAAPSESATVPQPAQAPVTPKEAARGQPMPEATARPDIWTITKPIHLEMVRVVDDRPLLMGTPPGQMQKVLGMSEGAKAEWFSDEQSAAKVPVAPFAIGRHPVTNAQYAAFVGATGHAAPSHWDWGMTPPGQEDHPVANVTWYDAVAFTEWLSKQTGRSFRLPTEAEWEKAARGADGRLWPWGNDWDPRKANTNDGGPRRTTPVGQYSPAGGDSPYGCADMAGNVWEWTSSLYKPYPYDPEDGREDLNAGGARVVRGGSWNNNQRYARCAFRSWFVPDGFYFSIGFRVVLSLSS